MKGDFNMITMDGIKIAKKRYTVGEDQYLKDNYMKFSHVQMGIELERTESSIEQRIGILRKKGLIGCKQATHRKNIDLIKGSIPEIKLLAQGQRNGLSIIDFKNRVKIGDFIKLVTDEKIEKCLVEYVNKNYFMVKRKNYRDSYKFVELMQGLVTILV
jgi:hypothetical protein